VKWVMEEMEKLQFSYRCHKTIQFSKAFRKLDKRAQKEIDKGIIEVLLLAPFESKKLVSPELRGKRSLRKGDYRIIFAMCEECRKLGEVRVNHCDNCQEHSANCIILFDCGHRKHIYDA
jgi:mRNA-degrading endonuclease RelE of RelBE toxin-antitoxin system